MHHDKCYDAAVDSKTCFDVPEEYVDDYSWKCVIDGQHKSAECLGKSPVLLLFLSLSWNGLNAEVRGRLTTS